jgi:acetolactate synthase-1/2/3 large subunit
MTAPTAAPNERSAAEILLATLHRQGIEHFFANGGTDFPPIVEAFARGLKAGTPLPRPMVVPHETAAVAMAHGYYMVTGRPQAVMVHVNVGTGNTINTLINAARDQTPLLLMAGRSPITEKGRHGSRNRFIHWAQEMFDQAGMVREIVKWEYELRLPDQAGEVVARALEVAMTSPRGPVYLTLPREVIAGLSAAEPAPPRAVPAPPHPDPGAIERLAGWLAEAERPLVITSAAGRTAAGMEALARVAERHALPVVAMNPRFLCLPSNHPMHLGYASGSLLKEADLVIVLDSDVPWYPDAEAPAPDARIVQIGEDPGFVRYPMRTFPADLAITAETSAALTGLDAALERRLDEAKTAKRRQRLAERADALRAKWAADGEASGEAGFIKPEWLSRCIGEAVGPDALIVNEYPLRLEHCPRERPGSYFGLSPAGGLGWGFGAALGAQLADPDRLVVATLGDGAYVFANPSACHWVAATQNLPVLVVVFNNQLYGAVRNATLGMYGKGAAAAGAGRLLADLSPSPAFEKYAEASGGWGERVENPADLPAALARAVAVVRKEKRQALLNVICKY